MDCACATDCRCFVAAPTASPASVACALPWFPNPIAISQMLSNCSFILTPLVCSSRDRLNRRYMVAWAWNRTTLGFRLPSAPVVPSLLSRRGSRALTSNGKPYNCAFNPDASPAAQLRLRRRHVTLSPSDCTTQICESPPCRMHRGSRPCSRPK